MAARYLVERGHKIMVNRYWMSGQSIVAWDPLAAETLYTPWVSRCQLAATRIAVPSEHWCVVLQQGEGDCGPGQTAANYSGKLAALFAALRTDLASPNLRVVQGRMSNNQWGYAPYTADVNAGMDLYATIDPLYTTYVTDDLQFAYDGSHFLTLGALEAGVRLGKKIHEFCV